jgi:ribosomal protein L12E/L44/L45/RPP1/RPP2
MAMIELVDFNELYNNKKGTTAAAKGKTTRRRGAKKASVAKAKPAENKAEEASEEPSTGE